MCKLHIFFNFHRLLVDCAQSIRSVFVRIDGLEKTFSNALCNAHILCYTRGKQDRPHRRAGRQGEVIAMGKRPTIQMVADRAGVSRGTVDRVINNRSYVRAEVRQRVLAAIQEVGYLLPGETRSLAAAQETLFSPIRLGVVLPNWGDEHFRTEIARGIQMAQEELSDFQVEILSETCQTDIPGEVIERIDSLLARGVQGISLCALDDLVIESKIDLLSEQGIPVITFNSDLPGSRRLCFIGQDYCKSGRIAAELMGKCIPSDASLLATVGNLEFNGHRSRLDGFCARMREMGFHAGQIEVVETYNDYRTTYRKVTDALARNPELRAVYLANQSVAGCVEAIRAAGRQGQIRVICHDVSESTKRLLREGAVDLTITQDMQRQGYLPLVMLRELLQKGIQPNQNDTNPTISIVCSENL